MRNGDVEEVVMTIYDYDQTMMLMMSKTIMKEMVMMLVKIVLVMADGAMILLIM